MKTIYNEGRIVGQSAYELYIRQLLSVNPNATPLDERTWLSASLSANQSMILKIPAGTERGVHDYVLPENSDLCGCSVIYASIFEGECDTDESGWARNVRSYGRLIENTGERHPETPGTHDLVPTAFDPVTMPEIYIEQLRNYIKVTSALMIQPGTWESNIENVEFWDEAGVPITDEDGEELLIPYNSNGAFAAYTPDLSLPGFIRLAFNEDTSVDMYILFHGFSYKTLVNGEVGYEKLDFSKYPEDGDFLGPARFPWGCKIILTLTSDLIRIITADISSAVESIKDPTFWSGSKEKWDEKSPAEQALYRYVAIKDE